MRVQLEKQIGGTMMKRFATMMGALLLVPTMACAELIEIAELTKEVPEMICTPNTGHPVLGVFLCDTVMNTRRCASNYIDKENGSRHQKE